MKTMPEHKETEPVFSPERSALRGIGSSGVVACHVLLWCSVMLVLPVGSIIILQQLANVGWMGVVLFLTLSIYLLMGSLDANPDLKRYYLRRIKRIWPLYFAVCVMMFVLLDHDWAHLAWNASFLAVFNPAQAFDTGNLWAPHYVIWTLQVEEWAYLCFPLIAMLKHEGRLAAGWGLIGFSVAVIFLDPSLVSTLYITPWPWLCCYGFGLLAYEMKLPDHIDWLVFPLALLPFLFPQLGWPVGLLLIGPAVAWIVTRPPTFLKHVALVAVGECSYALYMIHALFIDFLGPLGIVIAYPAAWWIESLQRGKQMQARIKTVL